MAHSLELVTEAELREFEDAWRELFQHCSYPTPFASWEWAMEWWQHFAVGSAGNAPRLLIVAIYDDDSVLIGVAPFYHATVRDLLLRLQDLRLFGDLGGREESLTEEPILLLRAGREQEALGALLAHLRRHRFGGCWDYVNLRVTAWNSSEAPFDPVPVTHLQRRQTIPLQTLALPDSWEILRGALSKSMRDNLAYYPRLLRRRGHSYSIRIARAGRCGAGCACFDGSAPASRRW